jgi:hypothetical protein
MAVISRFWPFSAEKACGDERRSEKIIAALKTVIRSFIEDSD